MMKLYFYKQAPSPIKSFFFPYSIVRGVILDGDNCEALGLQELEFPEPPEGAFEPVATRVGEVWVASWDPTTREEREADTLAVKARIKREQLLNASDWTQLSDSPVDQEAWSTYRQALRDIPTQAGFPHDITWPTKP